MATSYSKPKRIKVGGKESPKWYSRVNRDGKRSWRSTGTENFHDARRIVAQWQREEGASSTKAEQPKPQVLILREAAGRWLKAKKTRVAPKTYQVYDAYVSLWVKE